MKRSIVIGVGLLFVLAACSSDSKTTASASSSSVTTTTSSSSSSSPASGSTSSSSAAAAGPTTSVRGLTSAENTTLGKPILVTDLTMTVYLYEPDGSATTSTVSTGLRSTWPPVVATDPANVTLTGIDPSKLGTAPQPDGTKQLTYNGHLLYTFAGDTSAGDAGGQGLGGVWFTLSAAGDKNA